MNSESNHSKFGVRPESESDPMVCRTRRTQLKKISKFLMPVPSDESDRKFHLQLKIIVPNASDVEVGRNHTGTCWAGITELLFHKTT